MIPASVGLHLATAPQPTPTPSPVQSEATPSPKAPSGTAPATTSCPQLPSSGAAVSQDQARQLLQALKAALPTCLTKLNAAAKPQATAAGFTASTQPATLRATSLWMYGMSYDGVVTLPSASGSAQVLKFTMTKASMDGVTQSMGNSALKTPNLVFDNGVTMYTTKMSGTILGIPLTLEPGSPLLPLLQALNLLHLPVMEMSDIVSEQPAVHAGTATAQALTNTA